MLIDWFTVGAQAINFLILVWLMKRFLYKPILNAIDLREKKVAAELADADARRAEAQNEREQLQAKNEQFDQERQALMNKAQDAAKAEREKLLEEARQAADQVRAKSKERFAVDAENLRQSICERTQKEVFAIARKTLSDLASASLEEQIAATFISRIREIDSQTKASLVSSVAGSATTVTATTLAETTVAATAVATVRSAFDLSSQQRADIEAALNQTLSTSIQLGFETAPDLIGGIELVANGQSIAWNISDYLKAMEKVAYG